MRTRRSAKLAWGLVVACLSILVLPVGGHGGDEAAAELTCEISWARAVDGDWGNESNWEPAQLPGAGDVACLPAGDYTVSGITGAGGLVVGAGVTAQTAVGPDVSHAFSAIENAGNLVVAGAINLVPGPDGSPPIGISNSGTLTIKQTGDSSSNVDLGGSTFHNGDTGVLHLETFVTVHSGEFVSTGSITFPEATTTGVESVLRLALDWSELGGKATGGPGSSIQVFFGRSVLDIDMGDVPLRLVSPFVLFRPGFAGQIINSFGSVEARGTIPAAASILLDPSGEDVAHLSTEVSTPFFAPGELSAPDPDDHLLVNEGTITLSDGDADAASGISSMDRSDPSDPVPAPLVNRGTIIVAAGEGGSRDVTAQLHNEGTVRVETDLTLGGIGHVNGNELVISDGVTLTIDGSLQLDPGSDTGAPGSTLRIRGSLTGSGTILGTLDLGDFSDEPTTLAPGESPGTLVVAEDLIVGPDDTIVMEVRGDGASDRIEIGGNASFDGTLQVHLDEVTAGLPPRCTVFELFTFGSLDGPGFDEIDSNPSRDGTRTLVSGHLPTSISFVAVDPNQAVNVGPDTATVTEGQSVPVPMCLSGESFNNTLRVTASSDTGASQASIGFPFPVGVPISAVADGIDEPDEVVVVTGSVDGEFALITAGAPSTKAAGPDEASAAAFVGDFAFPVTVIDIDGPPTMSLSATPVVEGDGVVVTASLSAPSGHTVTGNVVTGGGTATPGVDYTPINEPVSFPPGVTQDTVTVTITGDGADEPNETIGVFVTNLVNATAGPGITITITDDDPPAPTPVPPPPADPPFFTPATPTTPPVTTPTTAPPADDEPDEVDEVDDEPDDPDDPDEPVDEEEDEGEDEVAGPTPEEPDTDDAADVAAADHVRASLPASLPRPSDVSFDLADVARSLALSVLLLLLLVFPAELLNKTIEENYDDITRRFAWMRRLVARVGGGQLPGWLRVLPFIGVGGALYVLLDPDAEFLDEATLAFGIGLAIALAVTIAAYELPVRAVVQREGARGDFSVFPAALMVGVLFVVLCRIVGFQPGYLFGLIAGFVFVGIADRQEGRGLVVAGGVLLTVSVGAWLVWDPIAERAEVADPSLLVLIADAALASTFVAGLESLVFGFVPMRFLDGHKVWSFSRTLWLGLVGLAMFLFVHLLVGNTEYVDKSNTVSALTIMILFGGFGIFSVVFWWYWRQRGNRPGDEAQPAAALLQ